eukprot:TRINITY_DN9511_c0_g1_i1.p1 TRINITY_DN9511_c0_g1~~TRINITY_DN9511_c0_g1_i1.p1  ORF type:complete len:591 (-),score=117.61 TRINITY_DN9511_c0_g1_i1:108-1880(-)
MMEAIKAWASLSRLHICLIGSCGSLVMTHLMCGGYWPIIAGIVCLDWFLINILNRVVDYEEDIINGISHAKFAKKHKKTIYILYLILLTFGLSINYFYLPKMIWIRLTGNFLGLAYNFRCLPGKRRIKDLYFFKNTASCAGFILTMFLYPLTSGIPLLERAQNPYYIPLLIAFFSFFEISFEIIYDLRDLEGDRKCNVKTYPVVHGEEFSVGLIIWLNVLSIVFLLVGAHLKCFTGRETIMLHGPLIQLLIFLRAKSRGYPPADIILLTWSFVGMLLWYIFWDVIGMPQEWYFRVTVIRVIDSSMIIIGVLTYIWNMKYYKTIPNFVLWYLAIAIGGCICENTCIHYYKFYSYTPDIWGLYVGYMPIEVCIIWPQVIFGVRKLLKDNDMKGFQVIFVGTTEIFFQAFFIEICNVQSGHWTWVHDNIYGVPVIGVVGWAIFGFVALFCMELGVQYWWLVPILSLPIVHIGLIICWKYLYFDVISEIKFPNDLLFQYASIFVAVVCVAWTIAHFKTSFRIHPSGEVPRLIAAGCLTWVLIQCNPPQDLLIFAPMLSIPYLYQTILASIESIYLMLKKHREEQTQPTKKTKSK